MPFALDQQGAGRRALVTGGCGFLGRPVVRGLLADGWRVCVLDDLSTGDARALEEHPRLERVVGSVLDADALGAAAAGVDLVVHLASVVGMRRAVRERARTYTVAAEGTRLVLERTDRAPAVLFSSSAVYGLAHADPAREGTPLAPADTLPYDGGAPGYATGKLHLETLGRRAADAGRPVLVVRPFNVVGAGQKSAYGAVLPAFVERALAGEPLEVHDDGEQCRAFSERGTFHDALARLAARGEAWDGRPINVGADEATSVLELARTVRRVTGARVPIRHVPYGECYPGHRDVRARVPAPGRLAELVGPIRWPGPAEIVRAACAARGVERAAV